MTIQMTAIEKFFFSVVLFIIIQHTDTLPKYGQKTLDVRKAT